jgi:hypothetical protein
MQAVTATSTKKADLIIGEIQSQIKNKNITVDVKANSDSNVNLPPSLLVSGIPCLEKDQQYVHFL